jgi:hypothetical protein
LEASIGGAKYAVFARAAAVAAPKVRARVSRRIFFFGVFDDVKTRLRKI